MRANRGIGLLARLPDAGLPFTSILYFLDARAVGTLSQANRQYRTQLATDAVWQLLQKRDHKTFMKRRS